MSNSESNVFSLDYYANVMRQLLSTCAGHGLQITALEHDKAVEAYRVIIEPQVESYELLFQSDVIVSLVSQGVTDFQVKAQNPKTREGVYIEFYIYFDS